MLSTTSIVSPTLSFYSNRASASLSKSVANSLSSNPSVSKEIGIKNADQLTYSSRMQSEARQNMILGNNLQGVVSLSQSQEASLNLAINKYERMSELAFDAQNKQLSASERSSLQAEFDQLRADIYEMREVTFNGRYC